MFQNHVKNSSEKAQVHGHDNINMHLSHMIGNPVIKSNIPCEYCYEDVSFVSEREPETNTATTKSLHIIGGCETGQTKFISIKCEKNKASSVTKQQQLQKQQQQHNEEKGLEERNKQVKQFQDYTIKYTKLKSRKKSKDKNNSLFGRLNDLTNIIGKQHKHKKSAHTKNNACLKKIGINNGCNLLTFSMNYWIDKRIGNSRRNFQMKGKCFIIIDSNWGYNVYDYENDEWLVRHNPLIKPESDQSRAIIVTIPTTKLEILILSEKNLIHFYNLTNVLMPRKLGVHVISYVLFFVFLYTIWCEIIFFSVF